MARVYPESKINPLLACPACTFASEHKERAAHHVQSHQEHVD